MNNLEAYSIVERLTKLLKKSSWLEKDKSGYTALHYAAQAGNVKCFKLLVDSYNFEPDELCIATGEGLTPLHLSYKERQHSIIQYMLSLTVIDCNRLDKYGRKPIDLK